MPPGAETGVSAIAIPCTRRALVLDGEGDLAGVDGRRVGLDVHVAERDVDVRGTARRRRGRRGRSARGVAAHADVPAAVSEERGPAIELVAANSQVVRGLIGDGRADLGVAASRPGATPNPAVRQIVLAEDEMSAACRPATRVRASRGSRRPTSCERR